MFTVHIETSRFAKGISGREVSFAENLTGELEKPACMRYKKYQLVLVYHYPT